MSILVFQHVAHEDPARLGRVLRHHGHRLRTVALYDGHPVPGDFDEVDGILSMGGPMNIDEKDQHPWIEAEMKYLAAAHQRGLPIVGICLGAQLIAEALGGQVAAMEKPEIGWHHLKLAFPGTVETLYAGIGWDTMQFHFHGQEVTQLPPGATPLAGSKLSRTQAFKVGLRTYGFQYHFEWEASMIERMAADPFVSRSDTTPQQIKEGLAEHYDDYARLGDRLCDNIATCLMPVRVH